MKRTAITPISEVSMEISDNEEIAFQKAVHNSKNGKEDIFYRFIRRHNGKLRTGGIPSLSIARVLIEEMANQEAQR